MSNLKNEITIIFAGELVALLTTFGAKARGLRASVCCRISRTVSSYSGLLMQFTHEQVSRQ